MKQNPSQITPTIDAKKETEKRGRTPDPAECAQVPKAIISKESFGRKQRRKPTEGWEQGGVQKVECKRHIQKGKCRQGTHTGRKHARWPATTCGFNRLRALRQAKVFELWDYGIVGCGYVFCFFVWPRGSCRFPLRRSPTSTKTEQKWDQNRPQMRPIWARGGEGAIENQQKYEKV